MVGKAKVIDYQRAMDEYEKSLGRKTGDVDIPLADKIMPDGGVDYQAAVLEYEKYLIEDQSEVIHVAKK